MKNTPATPSAALRSAFVALAFAATALLGLGIDALAHVDATATFAAPHVGITHVASR